MNSRRLMPAPNSTGGIVTAVVRPGRGKTTLGPKNLAGAVDDCCGYPRHVYPDREPTELRTLGSSLRGILPATRRDHAAV